MAITRTILQKRPPRPILLKVRCLQKLPPRPIVLKVCGLQKPPPQPIFLKVLGVSICRVQWSPKYEPSYVASKILLEPGHVLSLPTLERYKKRVREGLWWYVTSNTITSMRCMRSHGNRRLRVALTQALKAKGYDKNGRLLGALGNQKVGVELRGSMDIQIFKQCIDAEWKEVQKQAELVLEKIVKLCQCCKR
ncbi:MAG: hypothetical protein FRX48_02512 [Lasallia pustulata]|uniref:Uncharacterized protein n=1 Tax=Lasallia pustulata TaxID=136370 RepID=A0A5M8PZP0_9LECA|nr:MAG: hypothetical protein FRX48_02512 [Lasallia pustulata]